MPSPPRMKPSPVGHRHEAPVSRVVPAQRLDSFRNDRLASVSNRFASVGCGLGDWLSARRDRTGPLGRDEIQVEGLSGRSDADSDISLMVAMARATSNATARLSRSLVTEGGSTPAARRRWSSKSRAPDPSSRLIESHRSLGKIGDPCESLLDFRAEPETLPPQVANVTTSIRLAFQDAFEEWQLDSPLTDQTGEAPPHELLPAPGPATQPCCPWSSRSRKPWSFWRRRCSPARKMAGSQPATDMSRRSTADPVGERTRLDSRTLRDAVEQISVSRHRVGQDSRQTPVTGRTMISSNRGDFDTAEETPAARRADFRYMSPRSPPRIAQG